MGKKGKSSTSEEIDSILQRLRRSNESAIYLPPNQAQTIMGRRLGVCFLACMDEDISHEILQVLNLPTTNQSVPQAYFNTLQSAEHVIPGPWISTWMQLAQEAECINTLQAILSFYAWHCRQAALNQRLDLDRISDTYVLLHPVVRPRFVTILGHEAGPNLIRPLLSPIMAVSVLALSTPPAERILILDILLRSCWSADLTADVVAWQIESLVMLVDYADDALTLHWLAQIMDMMTAIHDNDVSMLVTQVIREILPPLFNGPPLSLQPILESALQISHNCESLDDETVFQLMTMILATPIQDDRQNLLRLLQKLSQSPSRWTGGLRRVMSCIFAQDEFLADTATALYVDDLQSTNENGAVFKILGIDSADLDPFLDLAIHALKRMDASKVPVLTQNSFLLLACGLVTQWKNDSVNRFVKALLLKFPYLGIPMVTVILDAMREEAGDGSMFLERLNFLCESVVHDPHCAQEIWNLVGLTLAKKDQPLSVRLVAIRMFSTLCATNRRLYRRVVDALGSFVEERQTEIRLSVVTVVCEMAKEDLIRDVSDVIGWLQTYLSDDHSSIVHLSILSLHYLVLNGELDFDLVIKVLGKRLCAVSDVAGVSKLAPAVVEALVVLLGDGEITDEEAEDEQGGLSPQALSAVTTLIELAQSNAFTDDRIRCNVFKSLTNYTLEALGIDDEAIKAFTVNKGDGDEAPIPEVSRRYVSLCKLVKDNIVTTRLLGVNEEYPVVLLAQKLVNCEEEALGASIWQKGYKNLSDTKKVKKAKLVSKSALAALPKPEEIYGTYNMDPSAATAIASLLCFNGKDVDHLADFAGDLTNETLSPMLKVLNIQAWVHAMSRVWSELKTSSSESLVQELTEVVQRIQRWRDTNGDIDYSHLALASLSLYLPDNVDAWDGSTDSDVNLAPIVTMVTSEAEKAFNNHEFTDVDIGHLCLAFAAVRSLYTGSIDVFARALDTLEKAAVESTTALGIFYGMSFMAQSVPTGNANAHSRITADRQQRQTWVGRIVGSLVNELHLCFLDGAQSIVTLVASLSSASPSPGLVKQLKALNTLNIQGASATKARLLLISLSGCLHSLVGIHRDLVHALFHLFLKLPLGSGVEYTLASIFSNNATSAVFTSSDLELVKKKLSESDDQLDGLYLSASLATETNGKVWIDNNMESFKSFDQMLALVSVVGSVPVLSTGERSLLSSSKMYSHSSANLVSAVVDVLKHAKPETAIVLQGLLSSFSLPEIPCSDAVFSAVASNPATKVVNLALDSSKLPMPIEGTLLHHIVSLIREELACLKEGNNPNLPLLCRLLNSLSTLSLPGQFATHLLGPLLAIESNSSDLNSASLQLLLSQFTGRRRAAMEGRDFVNLAAHVMSLQETTLFDDGGSVFYSGMPDLIRKSSTDLVDSIISQSWQNCMSKLKEHGDTGLACKWLEVMVPILNDIQTKNALSLSPRTSSMIRIFIVQDVFQSLSTTSATYNVNLVFKEVVKCFFEISIGLLDELAFFSFDSKNGPFDLLWKARCIAELVHSGYFEENERRRRITTSLFAWLSRLTIHDDNRLTVWKVGLIVASAVGVIDDTTKSQASLLLLEAMLVHGHEVLALDLLALILNNGGSQRASVSALCVRDIDCLPELSAKSLEKLWRTVLEELPTNLGSFAKRTKNERVFSNRIVQVRNTWIDKGAPEEKLSLLLKMLVNCKSTETSEKDTIAIMTSKLSAS